MDERFFDCAVCLDMCRECVNCQKCHQILCKAHVQYLSRCPVCRDEPFCVVENVALQRIIGELKIRMGIATPPPSPRESRALSAATAVASMAAPAASPYGYPGQGAVEVRDASDLGNGAVTTSRTRMRPATGRLTPSASQRAVGSVDPRYGTKIAFTGRRQGQCKKEPTPEHKDVMMRHINSCRSAGCHQTWNGPWGSFIGGRDGRTHFALTECTEGKRLNELLGWDYENPPC